MQVNPEPINPVPQQHCHHPEEPYSPLLRRVTAVALIAFAAYTEMTLFIPFFVGGVSVGIFQHYFREKPEGKLSQIASCAHGFLEQTTGVQLPEEVSVICGGYLAYHHIEHHPESDVPVAAIIAGAWLVDLMAKTSLCKPRVAVA
jgi:fatty acid desaturase